jgi:ribosomal-protein-alanine N-acetyltransferase
MKFSFKIMSQLEAEEIANNWKYEGIYSFYDYTEDPEDYLELTDPNKRHDRHFSCFINNELVGFYEYDILEMHKVELGFGLKPKYTGKGIGIHFIKAIIDHMNTMNMKISYFTLRVAQFNLRAIKVYKKLGFLETEVYLQETNGGKYEFIIMEKENINNFMKAM